jgi:hypothetical protein
MIRRSSSLAVIATVALAVTGAQAQSVISAHSGTVHYIEGKVYLEDKEIVPKFGQFPEIKEGNFLKTAEGRAEIILTPGVFLRVGENSAIRMVSNRLTNTQISVLKGSVLVECAELLKENAVTFTVANKNVPVTKKGLFRIDAEPPMLRVYNGEAIAYSEGHTVTVKEGRELALDGVQLVATKFNKEADDDELYRWAKRRAGYLAMANVSAARKIEQNSMLSGSWSASGWLWNPYFGMFTYLPYRGYYNSPFGYRFFSPYTVGRIYQVPYWGGGGGHSGWNNGYGVSAASQSSPSYNASYGYTTGGRVDSGSYSAPSAGSYSAPAASSGASAAPSRGDSGGGAARGGSGGGHR